MSTYSWIIGTLGLTREELANMLGLARRTVGYAIDSWRDEARIARPVQDRLSEAVLAAEAKATEEGIAPLPEIPPGLHYKYVRRQSRNLKELDKARRRKHWLETEYPLLLKAFAVSSHLDLTGLHTDPLLQHRAEVNHKISLIRMQRKIRKINYPLEMQELRVKIALLEAEREVLLRFGGGGAQG
jgi:hypothetical protein